MQSPSTDQLLSEQKTQIIDQYYKRLIAAIQNLPQDDIIKAIHVIKDAYTNKKRIFVIGNGGSHAIASHFVADLTKTVFGKDPIPGISAQPFNVECLADNVPTLTATANDLADGYNNIFSLPLLAKASPGDLLIAITGKGQSGNMIHAFKAAKEKGVTTIGFLGFDGGTGKDAVDHHIIVNSDDYRVIEVVHSTFMHVITDYFKILFGKRCTDTREETESSSAIIVEQYYKRLVETILRLPYSDISNVIDVITNAYTNQKRIFVIGNGGSHATSSQFVANLTKTVFGKDPIPGTTTQPFDIECLADNVPTLTATANDLADGYSHIFSLPLLAKASPGDLLIVITGKGQSGNIVNALKTAKEKGITTIGFLGFDGGTAKDAVDHHIIVDSNDYGIIEDVHSSIMQCITCYFNVIFSDPSRQHIHMRREQVAKNTASRQ